MIHLYLIENKVNLGQLRPTKADWLKEKKSFCLFDPQNNDLLILLFPWVPIGGF